MARTGEQLLSDFSRFIDDSWESEATASGIADGSTVVDEAFRRFGRETRLDGYIRVGTEVRRINGFAGSVATVSPPFSTQVLSGTAYSYHNYDPAKKLTSLDRARLLAYPQLAIVRVNETLTSDGKSRELDVPANLRKGPIEVWQETRLGVKHNWNLLTTPELNAVAGWTATAAAVLPYERNRFDDVVPRLNLTALRAVFEVNGTFAQTVGNMQNVTAAAAAGRKMAFGAFVYCMVPDAIHTYVEDDTGKTYSDYHSGTGWQFLPVTKTISTTNATTLEVGFEAETAVVAFLEEAWFLFGQAIPLCFDTLLVKRTVWHDDSAHKVFLSRTPDRGHQLRLIGRDRLTALDGDTTRAMEVDEASQELLFAKAARSLFTLVGMSTGAVEAQFPKIQEVESRFNEMSEDWKHNAPASGFLNVWQ